MDLFGRYVFKQAVGALLLILISLTAIVWLATALKELKLITAQGQSAWLFLKMTGLALPNLMAIIAPVALLISCFHTLNRLSGDSELIVMNASGARVWRIARPYILLSVIVSGMLVVTNFYVMPTSLRALREFIVQVRTDLISQVLQPGRFSSAEKGLTFHIRDRDQDGLLLGLVIHDERDPAQTMSYLAERAQIVKKDKKAFLVMYDGQIHQRKIGKKDGKISVQVVEFDKYLFNISQFGAETGKLEYKPRERYLSELLYPDPDDRSYKRQPGKFRSEIHERFASPLYPILFAMIAIASLGQARTTRQGRMGSIFAGFAVASCLRVCGLAATNLLTLNPWAVILVYGIPVGGIMGSALIAHAKMTPQSGTSFGFEWERISQALRRLINVPGRGAQEENS